MFSIHLLVLFLTTTTLAILPRGTGLFQVSQMHKVSSLQKAPEGFELYIENLKSSTTSSTYTSKKVAGLSSKSNNSTSSNSSKVLNLSPGITTLETDDNNECYFVNTTIGSKEYPLIIDTGSAYLWVYGDDCSADACKNESVYTQTSTASITSTFALAYVTGTASGEVVEDNIIVNKLATTEKFKFGKAKTVPDFFANYPVSGIFGLPSNDSTAIQSIISALYDSHAISIEKFSISLGNFSNSSDYPNSGIFAIGEPLDELYEGDVHYTDLIDNDSHYWLIPIEAVSVDSYQVNFTNSVDLEDGSSNSSIARKAIIDSGTTTLALPKQDALDIHTYFEDSITDGTNFAILCNSTLDIVLDINGHNWTIEPQYYLGSEYTNSTELEGYCVSNIQGIDSAAQDSWILGAAFLQSVYAVFDVSEQRMGFAEKNTDVSLTSTSTSLSPASSAAYYGNTSSISTSAYNSSSSSSSTSHKGAGVSNTQLSWYTIFTALVSVLLL